MPVVCGPMYPGSNPELVAAVMDELASDLAGMLERPGPLEERMEFMAGYLADHPETIISLAYFNMDIYPVKERS